MNSQIIHFTILLHFKNLITYKHPSGTTIRVASMREVGHTLKENRIPYEYTK
jgi:hypothetical protein